jgi:hypothetical protein
MHFAGAGAAPVRHRRPSAAGSDQENHASALAEDPGFYLAETPALAG